MSLTQDERTRLLGLARAAVEAAVRGHALPEPGELTGVLVEQRGCFVTLTNHGELRGCIGTFQPRGPLGEMVLQMGRSAATEDPRFRSRPITPAELGDLRVEVSVLSPLEKTEHPEQLEIGTHGIHIVSGHRSGCFLPEVATDYHMGAEEFLDTCCQHKAGLPAGAWRNEDVDVYLFTSEKVSEEGSRE